MTAFENAGTTPGITHAVVAWVPGAALRGASSRTMRTGCRMITLDGGLVGILLRQADGKTRTLRQCSWCEDVHLPNDVVFFSIKRAGQAGRNGDTVGTLACAGFECSANVRRLPPVAYIGFDVQESRHDQHMRLSGNPGRASRALRAALLVGGRRAWPFRG